MVTSVSEAKSSELTSSSLFFLGSTLWLITNVSRINSASVPGMHAGFGLSFGLLLLSVLPQFTLDLDERSHPHSRYVTYEDGMMLNMMQSFVFATGFLLQVLSYEWWLLNSSSNEWPIINLLAAGTVLLSASLSVMAHGIACYPGVSKRYESYAIHRAGNYVYQAAALVLFVAALDIFQHPNEFLGVLLQTVSSFLFSIAGYLYISATNKSIPRLPMDHGTNNIEISTYKPPVTNVLKDVP